MPGSESSLKRALSPPQGERAVPSSPIVVPGGAGFRRNPALGCSFVLPLPRAYGAYSVKAGFQARIHVQEGKPPCQGAGISSGEPLLNERARNGQGILAGFDKRFHWGALPERNHPCPPGSSPGDDRPEEEKTQNCNAHPPKANNREGFLSWNQF